MALVLADRVKETTTTAGTGTVTLLGASAGFQSFAVVGDGNTTYYAIVGQTTSEWEVGIGTYTSSGTTLARTTVLSNSSGTQPSALSFSAGTKDVFVTYPSGKSVNLDASGNATALGTPASFVGTNITGTASGLTAGNATTLATGRTIAITGDLAYTSPSFNGSGNVTAVGTLATVNPNVGSFTFSSITVNAKGLITAASSGAAPAEFVSGTRITFNQTAAPTGWTKSTSDDNKALRVVTGTVGTGGSVGFTTALATPTVTGSTSISVSISGTTGATTLTTAQIPSHTHTVQTVSNCGALNRAVGGSFAAFSSFNTGSTGGGGSHDHSFSGSGSGSGSLTSGVATINVAYVDVIIAQKN
jgi:hypothetical protein